MAKVSDVMNHAAVRCSLRQPPEWLGTDTATYVEMRLFLIETADELLDRLEFPSPITKDQTITGTADETYPLPADFKRLTRDDWAVYEQTRTRRRVIPVTSNAAWTHLRLTNSGGGERYYRTTGDESAGFEIDFWQRLEVGSSIIVSYVSKNWLRNPATDSDPAIEVSTWTDPNADLLLPEILVRLGVIWRFKQKKGLPYQEILAEYEARLSRAINDARGSRSINMGDCGPRDWRPAVPDIIVV